MKFLFLILAFLTLAAAERAYAEESAQTVVGAGKEGFYLTTGDGKFVLKFRGLIQVDGRFLCRGAAESRG